MPAVLQRVIGVSVDAWSWGQLPAWRGVWSPPDSAFRWEKHRWRGDCPPYLCHILSVPPGWQLAVYGGRRESSVS